jgi:hypothetical protein
MDEREITEKCMAGAKRICRGGVAIKHQDQSTNAVPDWSYSWYGATCWIEMKYLRKGRRMKEIVSPDQLILGHQLSVATDGKAWVVIFEDAPEAVSIWQPGVLFRHLFPNVAGIGVGGRKAAEAQNLGTYSRGLDLAQSLQVFGAIRLEGWDYDVVAHLINDKAALR